MIFGGLICRLQALLPYLQFALIHQLTITVKAALVKCSTIEEELSQGLTLHIVNPDLQMWSRDCKRHPIIIILTTATHYSTRKERIHPLPWCGEVFVA